jgi:hypothetical protein
MTDALRSGGVNVDGGPTIGADLVGRDKITATTNNIYAGLAVGDMFRLRLVLSYEHLWGLLEPLARYGRAEPFTADSARSLSERLRAWYFQAAGGMYLYFCPHLTAHHAYMELQRELKEIIAKIDVDASPASLDQALSSAQDRAHDLRQAMAQEIRDYMRISQTKPDVGISADLLPPA